MAYPASFDESNNVLARPKDMSDEECAPLSVCHGTDPQGMPLVISCWKLTAEELAEINKTGRVWLGIVGHTMPPVWVLGTNPFKG